MAQKVSLGRIVMVRTHQGQVQPAIVTKVWTDTMVNLTVFPDFGQPYTAGSVEYDEGVRPNVWFWPPKV